MGPGAQTAPGGAPELARLTAEELLLRYRRRELSPVEVARACLEAIERNDDLVHAFCLTDHERALASARDSEARWRGGEPRGLVDGVPAGVKDVFLTAGWPTLRGFPVPAPGARWDVDAPAVAALRRHGAVIVGKTTTPQLGWKAVTDGPGVPPTRNPWDRTRTAGGSSGGSAAALALGMVPLALGTDGGGSIRIPGAFCGIVGLKPTFARVPQWPPSPFGLLAHAGPMARTVTDTALLLDVLAEPDPREWAALPPPAGSYSGAVVDHDIAGVRIAFSPDLGHAAVDPEVAAAVAAAATALEQLGARVEQVDPAFDDPRRAFDVLWGAGAAAAVAALAPEQRGHLDPALAALVERAAGLSAANLLEAEAERARLGTALGQLHAEWDLLVCPTVPIAAFEAGREAPAGWADPHWPGWTPLTYPFNITQQPALTLPCGFTADRRPIGLQIVGRRHAEELVLRVARAYEARYPQPTLSNHPTSPGGHR
jgi:aspartyl-tRNA(Asn)/glutamyl-tRNA(Gln) amidotransferase subunit A